VSKRSGPIGKRSGPLGKRSGPLTNNVGFTNNCYNGCGNKCYPGFNYCCKTCAVNPHHHGQGCIGSVSNDNCANSCGNKCYPGFNYCCRTCANHPHHHGQGCTGSVSNNNNVCDQCNGIHCSKPNTIFFYHKRNPYYEFTNFYNSKIIVNNVSYPTVEHYFQAQKFVNHPTIMFEIINAQTPRDAFDIARRNSHLIPSNWHQIKHEIMKVGLRAKFDQHDDLSELLKNTGTKELVEHTKNDSEWGDNGDGSGNNFLGKYLMEIRIYHQN